MRRWLMALMVSGMILGAVACGVRPTGIRQVGDPPVASGANIDNVLFFVRSGKLVRVVRQGVPGVPWLSMAQLGEGVTKEEQSRGLKSELTRDYGPHVDAVSADTMSISVSSSWGEDSAPLTLRAKAQIACTAAAVPGIKRVYLSVDFEDGQAVDCVKLRTQLGDPG